MGNILRLGVGQCAGHTRDHGDLLPTAGDTRDTDNHWPQQSMYASVQSPRNLRPHRGRTLSIPLRTQKYSSSDEVYVKIRGNTTESGDQHQSEQVLRKSLHYHDLDVRFKGHP